MSDHELHQEALAPIVGAQLCAVAFVQDYVQLQFVGAGLTAVTLPAVKVGDREFRFGEPGYRDTLCECIGKTVRKAGIKNGEEIHIEFSDGSLVVVSLRRSERRAEEAVILHSGGRIAGIW